MLEALLTPRVIAVIGASRTPGKVGHELVANLLRSGFEGTILPVNPAAESILGLPCYPDTTSANQTVDLGILCVPPERVLPALRNTLAAGAKGIILITAGFKEISPAGARQEQEIAALCASRGARLLGPNCLGLINTRHRMNASFAKQMPSPGGITLISQSGAICTALLDWAEGRHLGMAKLVSMGNKADLCETDFLQVFAGDDQTRVIAGYLESVDSGRSFIKAAEAATEKKPVVIFKAGVSQAGRQAASSHTGSLAGTDIAYGAAFRRSGIIRADSFEALFDYASAFAMQPLPAGRRVAIITNAGGPGIMAADAADLAGLKVQTLRGANATALAARLPAAAHVENPIDVLGDADPERYALAVQAARDDDSIDAIIVILTPQAMTEPAQTALAIAACDMGNKPILVSFMGGHDVLPGRDQLVAHNLPDYPAPERAVAALAAMCEYAEWRHRPARIITRFPVNRRRVERILHRHEYIGQRQVGEAAAKEILRAYDFNVPEGDLAADAEQAVALANKLGYPVAMKISSPHIIHKSDIGGVKLNLGSAETVVDAYDLMLLRIGQKRPDARIEGVYIERMCARGREVILGMTRDPQFGPMLMFGLGGIFVEVMKDVTFHIAPITEAEALQMLESTRSFALLKGMRGEAQVDLSAIATALQRISQLSTEFPQIVEMDINPFIVGELGKPSIAADARFTLKG